MMTENLLVDTGELPSLLSGDDAPTVIEVRWSPTGPTPLQRYLDGHLPGAAYVDLETNLAAPAGARGRHPLPPTSVFELVMRRCGVRAGYPVVVYDERDSTIAARLWWMLRYYGHNQVRVLDGGFQGWQRAGLPVETGSQPPRPAGDFTATPDNMRMLTVSEIPSFVRRGLLLDARLEPRFLGDVEPLDPVAGHIPGAVSAPTFDNSDADGRFLSTERLRARFASLGVAEGTPIGSYCGSGVTAAHQVLALRLAGFDAALYVGSWSEWVADPRREVAAGPA